MEKPDFALRSRHHVKQRALVPAGQVSAGRANAEAANGTFVRWQRLWQALCQETEAALSTCTGMIAHQAPRNTTLRKQDAPVCIKLTFCTVKPCKVSCPEAEVTVFGEVTVLGRSLICNSRRCAAVGELESCSLSQRNKDSAATALNSAHNLWV